MSEAGIGAALTPIGVILLAANEALEQARRDARIEALRKALHEVEEMFFTADNDIEEAQCNGIGRAREAIQAMIDREIK